TGGGSDDAEEICVDMMLVLVQHDDSEFWRGRGALGRGHVHFVALVRSYRWIAMWRTDSVGDVANKGRGRWQRGDLGGRKRRSGGCSRRSRCCYVSVALRKKTLAMSKDHERLRTATAMVVAAIVLGE
ncbi:hypothetical protein BHM03_00054740, partial [Ensete ventricosum]